MIQVSEIAGENALKNEDEVVENDAKGEGGDAPASPPAPAPALAPAFTSAPIVSSPSIVDITEVYPANVNHYCLMMHWYTDTCVIYYMACTAELYGPCLVHHNLWILGIICRREFH